MPSSGLLPYWFEVHDKHVLSEEELKTQQYDKEAFKLVSYGTIPLLIGYTIYSLLYESHRGWYSFVISTLTSFVYMFGFVQLIRRCCHAFMALRCDTERFCPAQLIINYHLKSVAHMPVKSLIFKTLTTVVDDFFSFCIKVSCVSSAGFRPSSLCFRVADAYTSQAGMLQRRCGFCDSDVSILVSTISHFHSRRIKLIWSSRIYRVDPKRANECMSLSLAISRPDIKLNPIHFCRWASRCR